MRTRDDRRNALNLAKREARNKLRRILKLEPTPHVTAVKLWLGCLK